MYKYEIFKDVVYEHAPKEITDLDVYYVKEVKINLNPHNYKDGEWTYSLFQRNTDNLIKWQAHKKRIEDMIFTILRIPNVNTNISVSGLSMDNYSDLGSASYWSNLTFSSDFWYEYFNEYENKFELHTWDTSEFDYLNSMNVFKNAKPKLLPGMKDNGFNDDSHSVTLKSYEDDHLDSVWYSIKDKNYTYHPRYIIYNKIFKRNENNKLEVKWDRERSPYQKNPDSYYYYNYSIESYKNKNSFSKFEFLNDEVAEVKEISNQWKNLLNKSR
ncbi:hypothetical protein HGG64_01790 [Mycoplasma phocoeninasale]|uniref:Uncharacterized protein n=1 Tax=Mycoplasma phocoeninasale TaxID=2726117 RepID=A0A858U6T4_9MOLU|nr:hypothetical protein [Mycoplasma phocoeninasale]QJG66436.1 hypothetical protein HGG64_01790 [Mycoplasma phocoeninasale]